MTRIRVAQLVTGIAIGEQSGGAEQVALQIALRLDRSSFEPAVFIMRRYDSPTENVWRDRLATAQVPVYGFGRPVRGMLAELERVWRDLWTCVTTFRPDVVNSHSERGDTLNVLMHLLNPVHPRAVRTMHTDQQWQTRPWIGRILSQAIFPLTCAGEIAVSQAVRETLDRRPLAKLIGKQATVCYPAIDTTCFREAREAFDRQRGNNASEGDRRSDELLLPSGITAGRPRIGIVGRLMPQKGHSFLLQAIAQVVAAHPPNLLVIGAGPLEADLKAEAVRLGIAEQVHFLGHRSDVATILPHLDLLVSASLWEGLPGAVLEAMIGGIPSIATDVSGSREVILDQQTGLLVPPGRADVLARAIAYALDHPDQMRAMAQRGADFVKQFSVENMVEGYTAVYRGACSAKRGDIGGEIIHP